MRFLLTLISSFLFFAPCHAQEWPTQAVRIIVPYGPGGTGDVLARLAAQHLTTAFKQNFFVENRTGAGGMLGALAGAKAEPDGYTLTLTNVTTLVLIPLTNRNTSYDPIKDFTHIAHLGGAPVALTVNPSIAAHNVSQFIAYAKNAGRPVTFGSTGVGSDGQILGEAIGRALGIEVQHVPYQGTAPAMADLMGGRVDFLAFLFGQTGEAIKAGKLSGLAVTSTERLSGFPAIPTFKELGYDNLIASTWYSLSGPAKLPRKVAEALNREIAVMLSKPEIITKLTQLGLLTRQMSVDEFNSFLTEDSSRWKPMIEASGLLGKLH